jgi:hypothetical protein
MGLFHLFANACFFKRKFAGDAGASDNPGGFDGP